MKIKTYFAGFVIFVIAAILTLAALVFTGKPLHTADAAGSVQSALLATPEVSVSSASAPAERAPVVVKLFEVSSQLGVG